MFVVRRSLRFRLHPVRGNTSSPQILHRIATQVIPVRPELPTEIDPRLRVLFALMGSMLLSFVLGSVHAFSVLLPVMEETFTTSRTLASLTYSLSLVALAFAVLLGHHLYAKIPPVLFVMGTGGLAASGCLVAGFGNSVTTVWIGYSLLFGAANGLGYGYSLQFSGQVMPERKGLAMGAVTAAYALGAVIFPVPLHFALSLGGWAAALFLLAAAILFISAISATLLVRSRVIYKANTDGNTPSTSNVRWQVIVLLWLAYASAVTAGLMVIGHATGLAKSVGLSEAWIVASPIIIAFSNMIGSLICGVLLGKFSGRMILSGLAVLSSSLLFVMIFLPLPSVTIIGLAIVGFAYGGTISVYPAYISNCFGASTGTVIYGRVFTAWAVAGLLGPGSAGLLFDVYQDYRIALIVAAIIAMCSLILLKVPLYVPNNISSVKGPN